MPPRSFQKGRGTPPGRPAAPSSVPACGWAGPGLLNSPRPEPPGPSSSGAACGPPAGSGRGHRIFSPGLPHVHQRLVVFLVESRERLDDLRKTAIPLVRTWWQRRSGFLPRVSATSVTMFVRKEGSGQGWLGKTRVKIYSDKLKQLRTLRALKTSTLSVVSAITLSIRFGCLPLTDRAPESSLRLSQWTPVPRWLLYPVSTPITAIRHRWSSFCTWPTYLPLSPESFSRCRLRWTTPPSPQIHTGFLAN